MPRQYADNAYNRRVGRVGMDHGTAVISSSSRSGGGASFSSSSFHGVGGASSYGGGYSASQRTYVDNAQNRSAGRVGLPLGSAVISSSSRGSGGASFGLASFQGASGASSSASQRTYVDNAQNRRVGRVGLPLGSAVISSSSRDEGTSSLTNGAPRMPIRTNAPSASSSTKCYVNNPLNRSLDRVGLPHGSRSISSFYGSANEQTSNTKYSRSTQKPEANMFQDIREDLLCNSDGDYDFCQKKYPNATAEQYSHILELVLEAFNRATELNQWREESKCDGAPQTSSMLLNEYTDHVLKFEDITIGKKIGHGAFGDVHHATFKNSVIAVKKLRVQRVSKRRLGDFNKEVSILCTMTHSNVVRFIGACVDPPNLCMCMEYMQMSLFQALHIDGYEFPEEDKRDIVIQAGSGLHYLHMEQVAHCDMKTSNILINLNENSPNIVKITDFGLSMMKNDAETSSSRSEVRANVGTPRYSAPEVLRGDLLNLKEWKSADVYSFALVIYEIVCEEVPFDGLSIMQLKKLVGENHQTPKIPPSIHLDKNLEQHLKKCWSNNTASRPSAEEVVNFHRDNVNLIEQL